MPIANLNFIGMISPIKVWMINNKYIAYYKNINWYCLMAQSYVDWKIINKSEVWISQNLSALNSWVSLFRECTKLIT